MVMIMHSLAVLLMEVDVWMVAVVQLFETVESLCVAAATLTNNMKQMMETVVQSNANPVNPNESETLRLIIRG